MIAVVSWVVHKVWTIGRKSKLGKHRDSIRSYRYDNYRVVWLKIKADML